MLRRLHSKLKATWWILRGHAVVYRAVLHAPLNLSDEMERILIADSRIKGSPTFEIISEAPQAAPGRA